MKIQVHTHKNPMSEIFSSRCDSRPRLAKVRFYHTNPSPVATMSYRVQGWIKSTHQGWRDHLKVIGEKEEQLTVQCGLVVTFKKCYKSLIVSSLSNVGWEWNVNPNCPHIFRRLDTAHLRTIRRTRSVQHVYFGAREARGIGPKNFSTVFFFIIYIFLQQVEFQVSLKC